MQTTAQRPGFSSWNSYREEESYSAVSMFASLSPFLVYKWLLLLIFCRILISLGYLWGIDSFWLSMSDTALPNAGRKQLTTPRKLFENLVYWSCWEVSITCGKMTHRCDLTIAFILNFWQWKHHSVLTEIFSQGWACLWLSDVSHSLCRKPAFWTAFVMVLARNLLERC